MEALGLYNGDSVFSGNHGNELADTMSAAFLSPSGTWQVAENLRCRMAYRRKHSQPSLRWYLVKLMSSRCSITFMTVGLPLNPSMGHPQDCDGQLPVLLFYWRLLCGVVVVCCSGELRCVTCMAEYSGYSSCQLSLTAPHSIRVSAEWAQVASWYIREVLKKNAILSKVVTWPTTMLLLIGAHVN